jgi:hypothetical protein
MGQRVKIEVSNCRPQKVDHDLKSVSIVDDLCPTPVEHNERFKHLILG